MSTLDSTNGIDFVEKLNDPSEEKDEDDDDNESTDGNDHTSSKFGWGATGMA